MSSAGPQEVYEPQGTERDGGLDHKGGPLFSMAIKLLVTKTTANVMMTVDLASSYIIFLKSVWALANSENFLTFRSGFGGRVAWNCCKTLENSKNLMKKRGYQTPECRGGYPITMKTFLGPCAKTLATSRFRAPSQSQLSVQIT